MTDFLVQGQISQLQRDNEEIRRELAFLRAHVDRMATLVAELVETFKPVVEEVH